MQTTIIRRFKGKVRDTYVCLIMAFPLTSIHTEEDFEAAQAVMDRLLAKGKLLEGEELYLDALSDLVAVYEDEHHSIEPASDADILRHLLEAKNVTQTEVCSTTGIPKSSLSEVLSGKKQFSRQMIRSLAHYFQIDASVLTANF